MQIKPEILSEKNYTGTRLILIDNPKLEELQKELNEFQAELNPILDRLQEGLYSVLDPIYQELNVHQEKIKELKALTAAKNAEYAKENEMIEALEQKAQAVKNKMQPLILDAVDGQLGEFEEAKNTVVKDGKVYAEVFDLIEEKVKAIRASKAKK